jgi:hypothetical protein
LAGVFYLYIFWLNALGMLKELTDNTIGCGLMGGALCCVIEPLTPILTLSAELYN